jgi:hypothetical protein
MLFKEIIAVYSGNHTSPEVGTSSIELIKQSKFYLTMGTDSSLRNVVF